MKLRLSGKFTLALKLSP